MIQSPLQSPGSLQKACRKLATIPIERSSHVTTLAAVKGLYVDNIGLVQVTPVNKWLYNLQHVAMTRCAYIYKTVLSGGVANFLRGKFRNLRACVMTWLVRLLGTYKRVGNHQMYAAWVPYNGHCVLYKTKGWTSNFNNPSHTHQNPIAHPRPHQKHQKLHDAPQTYAYIFPSL